MKEMKTIIKQSVNIFLLCLCSWLLFSCQKAPMNGKADGHWQLMSFETTDGTVHPCERIYYSIQLQLIDINDKGNKKYGNFIGRFHYDQEAEKIEVKEFRRRYHEDQLATVEQLLPFGMNSTETTFDVIKANGKTLILKSDYATLTLRSF